MTEPNSNPTDTFEVPGRYLNINSIEIRPADICALVEKPINFVQPASDRFRVTDLTHHDRWRPYRLSINKVQHLVLFNKTFAADKKAVDYYITLLQRCVSLAISDDAKSPGRLRIETDPGLITGAKVQSPRLMEFSTFCDLLSNELNFDRNRHRVIVSLLHSFGVKLQTHVENAVIAKFPKLETTTKSQSKNNPTGNHLKNTPPKSEAPPHQTVMAAALQEAQDKQKS
ncbi:hypothetical protein [Serratia phage PCH45]|uniref:hypothetical protein n=1 Tax=Serratia phage PCH45 TaxID=2608368 RepID=UPI0012A86202|nr:hypothetical protein [Serratia phage PCH45]